MPDEVPLLTETSFSHHYGPDAHGIDPATQWWCQTTRRPRVGDAIAEVWAPGPEMYTPLLQLTLWADDLDDTEAVGHYAIRITRPLVRVIADRADTAAWDELKSLLANTGPMGDVSQQAWHAILAWLDNFNVHDFTPLDLRGQRSPVELWSIRRVAEYLGYSGPSATGSARKQLHRWGIRPEGRAPGRGGESLYAADQVQAAHESRLGKGRHGATRGAGGRFTGPDGD
jgi:hypothetical protein